MLDKVLDVWEKERQILYSQDWDQVKEYVVPHFICVSEVHEDPESFPHMFIEDLILRYEIRFDKDEGSLFCPINNEMVEEYGIDEKELHRVAIQNMINQGDFGIGSIDDVYILSNTERFRGAAVVLNQEFMDAVCELLGESFYLLPASIHEWVAVRDTKKLDEYTARRLIHKVNKTNVPEAVLLSSNIYKYVGKDHSIHKCDLKNIA